MSVKMSLCVAMCTYNGEAYVREQLTSIANQTRLPERMVIVDDCSRDDTVNVLHDFAGFAPFPVDIVVNAANLGYVKNFDKAISLCTGDIILLADQDDVWKPGKLARIERFFIENPQVDAVFSDAELADERLHPFPYGLWDSIEFGAWERRLVEAGEALRVLLRRNVVTGATMAFRSELRNRLLPIPTVWVHDEWLAIMIAATGNIRFCPEKLIFYRQHGANQIGARRRTFFEKLRLLFTRREDFHNKLFRKTEVLRERLATKLPFADPVLAELDRKLAHLATRTKLPHTRLFRLRLVAGELLRGRYFRYSSGWKSVVRDLFEPL
jgi:glycosyltransferase involved in cell wall biosynthesis